MALATATAFGLNAQKLSPNAEALLLSKKGHKATMLKSLRDTVKVEVEAVKVFIDMNDNAAVEAVKSMGGQIYNTYGSIATAEVPVSVLREVSELPQVDYVEMGSEVHLCMDKARQQCYINPVHTNSLGDLPQAYTGNGVVVGVIDTGREYAHTAFRTADGQSSRIKRVWNQKISAGKAPEKFGYGVEYTSYEELKAAKYDDASEYHGSHTTSIAAGGDRQSKFYGVAPDADIVFVSFGTSTVDIPNAIEYIKDYAASVGKPCVINMSLGSHLGPHDGTSLLDRYFESAAGPGCIIVGSAGNEGEYQFHVGKEVSPGNPLKTILKVPTTSNKNTAIDIWGRQATPINVKLCLYNAKGKVIESYEVNSASTSKITKYFADEGVDAYFNMVPKTTGEGENPNVYIELYITSIADGRFIGLQVDGEEGQEINLWDLRYNSFVTGGFRGFTASDGDMSVGEIGGTGKSVITVGSYNSRFNFPIWNDPNGSYVMGNYDETMLPPGQVSSFSSHGPTADGRMKPDLLAPGAMVIAAANKYNLGAEALETNAIDRVVDSNGEVFYYFLNMGTSMSSPVVAGNMALWLEAYPELTPDMAREAIMNTAIKDENTGSEPNNLAGYGKLHSYAGLKYILAKAGVENIGADADGSDVKVWVEGGELQVVSPVAAEVNVYSASGVLAKSFRCEGGVSSADVSSLSAGIYVVRVGSKAVKVAIR